MNPFDKSVSKHWQYLWVAIAVVCVAFASSLATAAAMMSTKLLILIILAVLGSIALLICGNKRLFIFYCMILLAPWTIKKDFMFLGHMSGAVSFDLHVSDPFLLAMIFFQLRSWYIGHLPHIRYPASYNFWVALMLLGIWSAIFNPMSLPPAHEVYRMARILLWMIVLVNEVVRYKMFLHAAYALMLAAFVQSLFAYMQVVGLDFGLENYGQMTAKGMEDLGASTLTGERGVRRIAGIMTHPNVLGAYLAMSSAIALALLFSKLNSLIKTTLAAVWASFVIIIILTLSRAAWIDFAIIILGVSLLTFTNPYTRVRHTALRTAILGGIIIIGIAFSPQIISRATQSVPQAMSARWDFIQASKKMIADRPIFGYGLNNFTFYQPPYTRYGSVDKMFDAYGEPANWPVVHNSYLLVWVEQGTVGLLIWLWFHVVIIKQGIQNLRIREPTLHALNVALLTGFVAIMFDSLVSFFDRLQQGILIWTFAALIFALANWRRENEVFSRRKKIVKSADTELEKSQAKAKPSPWLPVKHSSGLQKHK